MGSGFVAPSHRVRLVGKPLPQSKVWTLKKYLLIAAFVGFMLWACSSNASTKPPASVATGDVTLGDIFTINGKEYNTVDY